MSSIVLVTGGGRSGKSTYALTLAERYARKAFIATMEGFDDESRDRIRRHRDERGAEWHTVEEPVDLAGAIQGLPGETEVAVVDCLTVWLGNLMHHVGAESVYIPQVAEFLNTLENPPCDIVVVTNEVGLGIIPDNAMARQFRDMAGMLNQRVAKCADSVILMVSGYPVAVKG